ncbi:PVC-type heme-binding CxxCH protein [Flavihumibacter profundi]|uniref:PVC-type heme-binding CxxCH protein n=1 Tax=Flavihumibacter profundi TaxID=2716883 RepID=UPI001CC6ED2F|nr:PVC-type heme-binding CxxCH protein [Flavihumibacter profundi]MBZ5856099.1 HEAT repeat domain-containing protein [Flavihumibacter profundi]
MGKQFSKKSNLVLFFFGAVMFLAPGCTSKKADGNHLTLKKGAHIILVGNNLGSRMMNYPYFETDLQVRYPDSLLYIRNMCDGGNTPGFRPHSGRPTPWAFPGAEKFQTELAKSPESEGFYEYPDQWITNHKADIIIALFGFNESFQGEAGLENYKAELDAFIIHTLQQKYNGVSTPQLAIVSPIAFEDLSKKFDLPDGKTENKNLLLYANAMKEVAEKNKVLYIDAFTPSKAWFESEETDFTIDGSQLSDAGYAKFGPFLADAVFGKAEAKAEANRELVSKAVVEKNWMWHNDIKIPNGVHVFGRRYDPFGPDNYPAEVKKIREMTLLRDEAIWKAAKGEKMDLDSADKTTSPLSEVKTNFKPSEKNGSLRYLSGDEALAKFKMAPGYKIDLFASEKEFPELAKPVQISFDNKGRLWVAVMPTYPHWRPGDPKPNDKLIILEDTNGDGKADKETTFADGLPLPLGFEFAPEGVYLSQGTNFVLLKDTNGDDKADTKEILLSGFDDHDTHHAHHAYTTDASGSIYMGQGVFLLNDIETSYGPVRGTNGGFFRYDVNRRKLDRIAQLSIPNPWGIAFDNWGQVFYAETSGPDVSWMMPGTVKPRYGEFTPKSPNLIEEAHKVRPTSGLEFISSRHFPDEVQGDMLINNTIGFLGTKEHSLTDDGTGYKSKHRQDLMTSSDPNFRPVDLEFAPDGSLYIADWHNVLIGHMQHNARDPLRDHSHGRIYRITYPSRPLVVPAKVAGASVKELLDNLKLPEYRTRYRSHRELRAHPATEVLPALATWIGQLDKTSPDYEHQLLEALWVTWGLDKVDQNLLKQLLQAKDPRVRAAAVEVVRFTPQNLPDQADLLMAAAKDDNGRVRLEAIVSASWLDKEKGLPIVLEAGKKPLDDWMKPAYETAVLHLNGRGPDEKKQEIMHDLPEGIKEDVMLSGKAIFGRDGYCITCHQPNGKGLEASGFPPLSDSKWVTGNEDRLIKLVLKGLYGPIDVNGKKFPGLVPMTPFGGMLKDEEVAAVLTYVRNSFGNRASAIQPEKVKAVRAEIDKKSGFYSPEELLKQHPMDK